MTAKADLKKILNKVKKDLAKSASKRSMLQLGSEALRLIRTRTRRGFGVRSNGRQYRFPRLSPDYIKQRRRIRLSPFTSPGKSNVTRSGRLVAGLRAFSKTGTFEIKPSGRSREGIPNDRIAEYLLDLDRRFIDLSKSEIIKLRRFYRQRLLKFDS